MDSRNATKHDGHSRIRSDKTLTEALDSFFVTIDWDTFTFTLFDHWVVLQLFLKMIVMVITGRRGWSSNLW
jgi:hypothetical protein